MVDKTGKDKDTPHILSVNWGLEELKDQLISSVSDVIKKYNNGEFEPTNISLKNLEDLEKGGVITPKELEQLIENKCYSSEEEDQVPEVKAESPKRKDNENKEISSEEAEEKVEEEIKTGEKKIDDKVKVIKDIKTDEKEAEKIDEKAGEVASKTKKKNRKFLGLFNFKRKTKLEEKIIEQEVGEKKENNEKEEIEKKSFDIGSALSDKEEYAQKFKPKEEVEENKLLEFDQNLNELAEKIEGFQELSEGQKSLVLENFKQLFLSNIKEDAQKDFKQELGESKFLGKIWKGMLKNYKIAKLEKEGAKEAFKLESEVDKQIMEKLVQGMEVYGPEVELNKNGEIEVQYAGEWKNLNEDEQKIVDNFNEIATKYSHMSYEWSLDTATKKQAKQFKAIKSEYEGVKVDIMNLKRDKSRKKLDKKKDEEALLYINNIDGQIQMNQFLNNNPEVEKELSNIKDQKVWKKALTGVIRERGIYAVAGFITRSVTTAAIGVAAVPLAAAGVGGWRANVRAREGLKQSDINARHGQKDNSKQAKNVVNLGERTVQYKNNEKNADIIAVRKGLIGKIDKLINDIKGAKGSKKKELLDKLNTRLKYTQEKLDKGLVNFGTKKDSLNNQYSLIHKLSEVNILLQTKDFTERTFKSGKSIESELEKLLNLKTRKISKERKNHIIKKTLMGAGISAGFASAGYLTRHLIGGDGLLNKPDIKDEISEVQKTIEEIEHTDIIEEVGNDSIDVKEPSELPRSSGIKEILSRYFVPKGKTEIPQEEIADIDSLEADADVDSLEVSAPGDTTGVQAKDLEADTVVPLETSAEGSVELDQELNNQIDKLTIDDQIKSKILILTEKGKDNDLEDILAGAEKSAVIERGEGVSQALGAGFKDADMEATVINPDGTQIQGDIHLAHTGDTIIQKDGQIYILKTSGVEVSKDDSLARAWIKVIEDKLDRKLTAEEIDRFDGKDGEMEWNEAKNLHDTLISEKIIEPTETPSAEDQAALEQTIQDLQKTEEVEPIVTETPTAEDQAALEQTIQDLQSGQEENITADKPSDEDMEASMSAGVDTSDDLDETENITAERPEVDDLEDSHNAGVDTDVDETKHTIPNRPDDLEESMNAGVDQSKIYEQFFNNENGSSMLQLNNETETGVLLKLGKPIEMKSGDGSFIKVDRFKFAGEDSKGRYFEYFKVGEKEPTEQVIFEFTENKDGNAIDNIEIKGYKDIEERLTSTKPVISEELRTKIDQEDALHVDDAFTKSELDSQITNVDYYDAIKNANPGVNNLEKEIVLSINGKNIEVNELKLISKVGKVENGEVTKHFIAHDTSGKKYSFITKEHWKVLHKGEDTKDWDQAYRDVANEKGYAAYQEGTIDYSIKEAVDTPDLVNPDKDISVTEEEIPGGTRKTTEFNEESRKGKIIEEQTQKKEGNVKTTINKESSRIKLSGGEMMQTSNEKTSAIVSALKNGDIDSKKDMVQKIQEIKEELTGNGKLTTIEEKSWGMLYKSYERNPNSSLLQDKVRAKMISFVSKL